MRKMLCGSLAVACLLAFSPLARAQDDARAVIEKAVKAHGGAEKLAKMKGSQYKTKGTIDLLGGITFNQDVTIDLGGKFKENMQMEVMGQQVAVTTVYDGTKGWIKVNDTVMDMNDDLLELMRDAMYTMRLTQQVFSLKDKEFELAPLGEIKVNEKPAVGIKVSSKGKKDVSMYFDKETGLMSKFDHRTKDAQTGQEVAEERIILEYQDVDGMKSAKKVSVKRDGKPFTEAEVLEVKLLDKVDDSEFVKP